MGRLTSFNFITLNGCCKGPGEDISWHRHGEEENEYAAQSLKAASTLLFGRVTYEMMASFWPSQKALKNNPAVAKGMNDADKVVFSKTLKKAEWKNTRLLKNNMSEEVKKIKHSTGNDLTLLGSGSILTQLAEQDLIDEYQFMIDPVAIGDGTPVFKAIGHKLNLELINTKTFKSGVILLCYQPLKN